MAQYEKVFTKPYEDGYENLPSQNTPITAQTLNDKDAAIEHIEDFLDGNEFPTSEDESAWDGAVSDIDYYVRNGFLSKSILPMSFKKIKSANTSGTWNGNTYTYNNVTYTIQTDINNNVIGIKCEGTTTSSNSYLYLTSVASLPIEDNTSITMSGCPSGGSWGGGNSTYAFRAVYGNYGAASNDVGNGVTFNYNSNYKRFYIEIASNYEIATGGLIFKPMIRYSVNTDATFTPYAPSNNALDAWKADTTSIGTNESDRATASKAYAIGEHFYKDGKFCTAIASIASGATLSLNTNYVEGTIAEAIGVNLPKKMGTYSVDSGSPATISLDSRSYYLLYSYQPYTGGHGVFGISVWGSSVILIQTISGDSVLTITAGTGQITVESTTARFLTLVKIDANL